MDPRTLQFLCFALFSVASLWGGYFARRKGWVHEDVSRRVHFHTVVWVWSAVSLLSLWRGPLRSQDMGLVLMQILIVGLSGYAAIPIAKLAGLGRAQIGVLAVASGLHNIGFTLGGYLCFTLLSPGVDALGQAIAYVTIMQIAGVVLIYPIARHFGTLHAGDASVPRLILANLTDIRSMTLYAAILGQSLGACRVPVPGFIDDLHFINILFYLGAFGGYFGIGLRLRLGNALSYWREHAILAGMKFLFIPALTLALIAILSFTPLALPPLPQSVALVEAFMPTAILTVMLANLFHLDVRLASVAWLWNTMSFFVLPMPLILWWLS